MGYHTNFESQKCCGEILTLSLSTGMEHSRFSTNIDNIGNETSKDSIGTVKHWLPITLSINDHWHIKVAHIIMSTKLITSLQRSEVMRVGYVFSGVSLFELKQPFLNITLYTMWSKNLSPFFISL